MYMALQVYIYIHTYRHTYIPKMDINWCGKFPPLKFQTFTHTKKTGDRKSQRKNNENFNECETNYHYHVMTDHIH